MWEQVREDFPAEMAFQLRLKRILGFSQLTGTPSQFRRKHIKVNIMKFFTKKIISASKAPTAPSVFLVIRL